MAISDLLNRRVRAQPEDDDEDAYSEESGPGEMPNNGSEDEEDVSDASEGGSSHDSDNASNAPSGLVSDEANSDEGQSDSDSQPDDTIHDSLNNISFGALAKAQASMGPKKQARKPQPSEPAPTKSPLDDIRARIREAREQKRQSSKSEKQSRASKHAPAVQSSKRAVTRKRPVVDIPTVSKARDPRFDPTVLGNSSRSHPNAGNAYSFLDEYRASELKEMKQKMAKTKDPEQKEELKRAVRSAGDRLRSIENKKRQQEVMAEHKMREKQLIREGKKSTPYYLKKSDMKEKMLVKKYEGMGSREKARALERRRKKVASKERKEMPMERRMGDTADAPDGDGGGGGRKRRRMA